MKKTQLNLSVLFFALIIILGGCKKDKDEAVNPFTKQPEITFDSSLLKPSYAPGEEISIPITIITNSTEPVTALSVYKAYDATPGAPATRIDDVTYNPGVTEINYTLNYTVEDKASGSIVVFPMVVFVGNEGPEISNPLQITIQK